MSAVDEENILITVGSDGKWSETREVCGDCGLWSMASVDCGGRDDIDTWWLLT
jgi:hypothetical protein